MDSNKGLHSSSNLLSLNNSTSKRDLSVDDVYIFSIRSQEIIYPKKSLKK